MSMFQAPGKGQMSKAQPQMSVSSLFLQQNSFVSDRNSSVSFGEERKSMT